MRNQRIYILLGLVAMLLVLAPAAKVSAMGLQETYYTVWYNCIIGPMPTQPVGEWSVDCDGNWTGWGWRPGDNCTRTEVTYGNWCEL